MTRLLSVLRGMRRSVVVREEGGVRQGQGKGQRTRLIYRKRLDHHVHVAGVSIISILTVSHYRNRLTCVTMSNPVDSIRTYALEAGRWWHQEMETDASDASTEARLDQTIKELQERLRARKLELEKVGILSILPSSTSCRNGRP